jgi:hypothetical protein
LKGLTSRYEGLLKEENQRRNTSIRAYYQDPNFEVDVAEFIGQKHYILETTYKKNMQAKGSNRPSAPGRTYHFDVDRADELFDILLESKYISLPDPRHKIFSNEELRGREHCKWHSSFTHSTNNCLTFRNIIQEKFDNKILKFQDKPKENMAVDTEPFPEMVDINMVTMSCSQETFINMYQALSLQGKRINSITTEMKQVKLNQKAADKEKGTYIQGQNIQINQGKMPMAED